MKLDTPSPAPDHEAAYAKLVSVDGGTGSGIKKARTRRAAKKPNPPHRRTPELDAIADAIEVLADRAGFKTDSPDRRTFVHQQKAQLLDGYMDLRYWEPLPIVEVKHFTSTPTSVPFTGPRHYDYPDDANQPTTPTYPPGIDGTGPARYSGSTSSTFFHDDSLTWRRTLWSLYDATVGLNSGPLIWTANVPAHITASNRGCRNFPSLIASHWLTSTGSSLLAGDGQPFDHPQTYYWRYDLPSANPPFYEETIERFIVAAIAPKPDPTASGPRNIVAGLLSPRPSRGLYFNNNTSVDVTAEGNQALYQISPCAGVDLTPYGGSEVHIEGKYHIENGSWDDTPLIQAPLPRRLAAGPCGACMLDASLELHFYGPTLAQLATFHSGIPSDYNTAQVHLIPQGYAVVAIFPGAVPDTKTIDYYDRQGNLFSHRTIDRPDSSFYWLQIAQQSAPDGQLFAPGLNSFGGLTVWDSNYQVTGQITAVGGGGVNIVTPQGMFRQGYPDGGSTTIRFMQWPNLHSPIAEDEPPPTITSFEIVATGIPPCAAAPADEGLLLTDYLTFAFVLTPSSESLAKPLPDSGADRPLSYWAACMLPHP